MRLPMASDVGVMEHVWLTPYANGKLGERMQFVAAGSTVQRPEVMVKNCCALVKPTIMSRKAPHVPPMQGRPEGYSISTRMRVQSPPRKQIRSLRRSAAALRTSTRRHLNKSSQVKSIKAFVALCTKG